MKELVKDLVKLYEGQELEESKKVLQAVALLKAKAGGTAEEKVSFLKSKGYSDNEIMDALKMIKESLDDMEEAAKKKSKDPKEDIEKQLHSMGFKKSVAKGLAPSVKNIEKMKVGKVYTIGEAQQITREELKKLKDKYGANDWNDQEFVEWYRRNHGTGYEIEIVEAIDWKKILASAAIIGALATVPVKGYAEDANVADLFNFLGRVVNTVQTARGGNAGMTDILGAMTGQQTSTTGGYYGGYGTHQATQGYAVWGGTSDQMVCTRANQADVGKYFKVINQSDNSEVVVKCTNADSTLGRNVVVSLSRGAFAQISDLNQSSVYVTIQEVD